MDEIYVYCIPLPVGINEIVTPCCDGFTVYIADRLDQEHRIRAYHHALRHIRKHFRKGESVQLMELHAHKNGNSEKTRR